jgi:membrane-bound lytic murein transglycosylase F
MIKTSSLGIPAILAFLMTFATVPPAHADLAQIERAGVLRVLVSADELPHMFSFGSSGDPGLEREMIAAFARARGLRLEIVQVERFDTIIQDLVEGRGDVVTGLIDTPSRREQIAFTVETLPARHLAVTRRPAPAIETVEALRERRVATVMGSSWTEAARETGVPPHNLVQVEDVQMLLRDLRAGTVEAAVMSVTDFAQAQRTDPELQGGIFVGSAAAAAWGVRKEDDTLRRALDDFLKALVRSPSWSQMVLRYFTQDALSLMAEGRR